MRPKISQVERSTTITMAFTSLSSLNLIPTCSKTSSSTAKHPSTFPTHLPSTSLQFSSKKREFPVPSVASIPYQPLNVEYLEEEFNGHGVTFENLGDGCIVKMRLDNGSTATLMLPSGLITSYKARMWHGGTSELLQTSVTEGEDGDAVVHGGVSLAFSFDSDGETSWSPSSWTLKDIKGRSEDSIQVEMISTDAREMVDLRYILNLQEDTLSSELVVSNSKSSSIRMMGSLISHLTVSTPEATFAIGLEGSNFFGRPMFLSNYSIVPPDLGKPGQQWDNRRVTGSASQQGAMNQNDVRRSGSKKREAEEELEGEETDTYKNLCEQMSMIYTSAPRNFTLIDRGRRNSVVVGRVGFDELYIFSPGSTHESYGTYSFICLGQSAILKPIVLRPGDVWTGGQQLYNPNV